MDYHNTNNHSLPTLENEFATIVRIIKLILIKPRKQISFGFKKDTESIIRKITSKITLY